MVGAIIGDMVGSAYEYRPIKTTAFPLLSPESRFTDDTVLTVAVAAAILCGRGYAETLADYAARYPRAGYGAAFSQWVRSWDRKPYGSCGNGAAMRVSPVGWAFDSVRRVLQEARRSAEVTHNHPGGIKGAQAVALGVLLARKGRGKDDIRGEIEKRFGYELRRSLAEIRVGYGFDVTCQGTVPEAMVAFFDSDSYEGAVRNAVSLGGDSDTLACITGAIAEAFYGGVPIELERRVLQRLPHDLTAVLETFRKQHVRWNPGDRRHGRPARMAPACTWDPDDKEGRRRTDTRNPDGQDRSVVLRGVQGLHD